MARQMITIDLTNVDVVIDMMHQAKATIEALRNELAEAKAWGYQHYTSTYCIHDLHDQCRQRCKTCEHPCLCDCHKDEQ